MVDGTRSDVRIDDRFHPFYEKDCGKDLGVATWPPGAWKTGGGTVWGWISYDPVLDLLYHGTANPGPWNPDERPGDNEWTSGISPASQRMERRAMTPADEHCFPGTGAPGSRRRETPW
jgi:glucose dehydrogenase